VPWCETCSRFYTPSTLTATGDCPGGHHVVDPPAALPQASGGADDPPEAPLRVPWHFWLLVAALVVYLGWRLVQGVQWILG